MSAIEALSTDLDTSGFAKAEQIIRFQFPQDHGPHPDFQTEWWYYTGNLASPTGRPFGYQLTFFRRALRPQAPDSKHPWLSSQVYFSHFTVSDIQNQTFYPFERWQRGALGLAGAQSKPYQVWLDHWQVKESGAGVQLQAQEGKIHLNLSLSPEKPVVLNGDQGLSQKSAGQGNASYYYSQTRLKTQGQLQIAEDLYPVQGLSWLDREWSTSVLGKNQAGWDWFSLQLDDQSEVMLYQLRLKDRRIDSHSAGTWIGANGQSKRLALQDFQIEVLDHWRSPQSQIRYPSQWRVKLPKYKLDLIITPAMPNQELPLSFTYWEGAVNIRGSHTGQGYVELTGYETDTKHY